MRIASFNAIPKIGQSAQISFGSLAHAGRTGSIEGSDKVHFASSRQVRGKYSDISRANTYFEPGYNQYHHCKLTGNVNFTNARNYPNGENSFRRSLDHLFGNRDVVDFSGLVFEPELRDHPYPWVKGQQYETDISFMNARLVNANFNRSVMPKVNFMNAWLRNARFIRAELPKANFMNSRLVNVNFRDADLSGADFYNADLRFVKNLDKAKLIGAKYNASTRFPKGFKPAKHGMI